jgi:hypothetical protein
VSTNKTVRALDERDATDSGPADELSMTIGRRRSGRLGVDRDDPDPQIRFAFTLP